MHLAFVDFVYFYDAARPEMDEPLGGTTSAICFLARDMVTAGMSCTFFNRVDAPCGAYGIRTLPLQALGEEIATGTYDAYVFCGRWSSNLVELVRANTDKPLIGWMHESAFVSPMTPALDAFDGMVFVSDWQKRVNQNAVRPHWKQAVIRNAMNPAVAAPFPEDGIGACKANPPVLLFAGSFARGAFHVPPLLEKLREERADFTVEMYCNLNPSRDAEKDLAYIDWVRGLPNITHIGMVGQSELARRMRRASVFLAPNPWPETSCIALIEALASGMLAVTTDRAALTETASGFARPIPVDAKDDQFRFDMPVDIDAFAKEVLEALRQREQNPEETEAQLQCQVAFFRNNYQWSQRVGEWKSFVADLCAAKRRS